MQKILDKRAADAVHKAIQETMNTLVNSFLFEPNKPYYNGMACHSKEWFAFHMLSNKHDELQDLVESGSIISFDIVACDDLSNMDVFAVPAKPISVVTIKTILTKKGLEDANLLSLN